MDIQVLVHRSLATLASQARVQILHRESVMLVNKPWRVALVGIIDDAETASAYRLVCCSAGGMVSGLPVAPPPGRRVDIRIAQDQRLHRVVANTPSPVSNLEAGPPEDEELA